ncbi:gasdermin-E-like isoform X1 [Salarias fasciatus]|uniref:Gasdermin-E-like n=1 Tax=Salarias fasciatus TaxID=181472 RepID=A0A672FJH1_SALFA|nr:gasdermin-E-like isoform X1 [Salarias fasciatus]
MFCKATANFVRQVDDGRSLIPVSQLNDSGKLDLMTLVVKRKGWFWQKPKYQPTNFTLSALLLGDEVLKPEVSEKPFVTFKGTIGNQLSGKVEADVSSANLALEGSGTYKQHTNFGQLKKEELNVMKLYNDFEDRFVDMQKVLVQQIMKKAEVLTLVTARILTTSSCPIEQTKKGQCKFQGGLGFLGSPLEVRLKNSNSVEVDSVLSMEIPAGTVIAYSILELEIGNDGSICPKYDMRASFEEVAMSLSNCFQEPLNGAQELDLCPLAELPESIRCAFFGMLQEAMTDRPALTSLQFVLEEVCNGETLTTENGECSEDQERLLAAILDQAGSDRHSGDGIPAPLSAAHLLVSAIEELPDETLNLLSRSSQEDLKAFDTLMCRLKESSKPVSVRSLPVLLQDSQRLQMAEQLFGSAEVILRRDADCLWAKTERRVGVLPLYLSIHGLAVLCSGLK